MLPYEFCVEHSISHSKRYLPTWMANVCDRRNYNHLITVANIFYRNSDHHDWFIDLVNFIFQCFKLFASSKFPPVSMQCDNVSQYTAYANEKYHISSYISNCNYVSGVEMEYKFSREPCHLIYHSVHSWLRKGYQERMFHMVIRW